MDVTLKKNVERYITVWQDIADRRFTKPLPIIVQQEAMDLCKKEITDSFNGKPGKIIEPYLNALHDSSYILHYVRDIVDDRKKENNLTVLRGIRPWVKKTLD